VKTDEVISAGNTFAVTFLASFVFVYFAIIEPHFAPKGLSEQHVDEALQQIEESKRELKSQLAEIRFRHSHLESHAESIPSPSNKMSLPRSHAAEAAQLKADFQAMMTIHDKLVQLGVAQEALEKAKREKRQYSVPIVSISLDEETLLKFFPFLVMVALVRLQFHRLSLLKSISHKSDQLLPPWAAPLPFARTTMSFSRWTTINMLGFAATGIIVLLTMQFVLSYARENYSRTGLVAIDVLLIVVWTVCYLWTIVSTIFKELSHGIQARQLTAQENKPTSTAKLSRRALLGWSISAGAAAVFVAIFARIHNALSDVPALTFWRSNRTAHAGRQRAKLSRTIRKQRDTIVTSNFELVLVEHRSPSGNLKNSVVHWPHPSLFGHRSQLSARHRILRNNEWKSLVRPHCGKGSLWSKGSTTHFLAPRDAVIREHLALVELSFENVDASHPPHGLDQALAILGPIFDDDRNRCNWRTYHLYSKLVCWKEPDPERARAAILSATWNRPDSETKPKQLSYLSSPGNFSAWHKKCQTIGQFQRLRKRVKFSQSLRGGQSSSGQDTASAERAVRIGLGPRTTKTLISIHQHKLARRKARRGAKKRVTLRQRISVLWNRAFSNNEKASANTELKPRKNHPEKARHSPKCPVSNRRLQCIPLREKPRLLRVNGGRPFVPK